MSKLVRSFIVLYPDDSAKAQMADFHPMPAISEPYCSLGEHQDKVHITLKIPGRCRIFPTLMPSTSDLRTEIHSHNAVFSRIDKNRV